MDEFSLRKHKILWFGGGIFQMIDNFDLRGPELGSSGPLAENIMKSNCYVIERFNTPPPIFGAGLPSSPCAFIAHFHDSVNFHRIWKLEKAPVKL